MLLVLILVLSFFSFFFLVAGCRNISNALSIGTKIDRCSADLKEVAQKHGFWDGQVSATMFFFKTAAVSKNSCFIIVALCRNSSVYNK
jgi:hypothetical protein